jgi:hypothetical protein
VNGQELVSNTRETLQPALDRLAELRNLGPNWNTYDACPISDTAIRTAEKLLARVAAETQRRVADQHMLPQSIAPLASGGVHVEWRGRRGELTVEIYPDGRLGYLAINADGSEYDEDDVTLETVLQRLDLVLSAS